jgi:DNA-binding IclR family transcriptional regulator
MSTVEMKAITENTMSTRTKSSKALGQRQKTGVVISIGKSVSGAAHVAVPIFDSVGDVTAAPSICVCAERCKLELTALGTMIRDDAGLASGRIAGASR